MRKDFRVKVAPARAIEYIVKADTEKEAAEKAWKLFKKNPPRVNFAVRAKVIKNNLSVSRIKLVVYNEHTLGYIDPEFPQYVQVLHSSVLKGDSTTQLRDKILISSLTSIRLASKKDFEDYKVSFDAYEKDGNYAYDDSITD